MTDGQELDRCQNELAQVQDRNRELAAEVARLQALLRQQTGYLQDEIKTELHYKKLIGNSPALWQVRRAIEHVAATDSTALILGETGTGKELIARAIHERSPRRQQLLVKVNCAALAPSIITSELFGHEAGAFTGAAKRRIGRFELAHQGTLFLDEIAELSAESQTLLLRVLQERVIERVGGNEAIAVDVRIIVATHRDLSAAVRDGRFRDDLFYRLNVFPIHVPPLRERPEDIPLLLHHFRVQLNRRLHKQVTRIDGRTLEWARHYPWPGNVRELENLVERAMILSTGDTIFVDPAWGVTRDVANHAGLAAVERQTILDVLQRCGGKIYGPGGAAEALGLKPTTLYGKMRKLQIRKRPSSSTLE